MNSKQFFDFNEESVLERYGNGIRLVRLDHLNSQKPLLSQIMKLPMNIYFMDANSVVQNMNDVAAETCGYLSRKNAIGKSLLNVAKGETAQMVIKNDRDIIKTKTMKIIDENYTRFDDVDMTAISIKFPWFDNDETIGIFGCSILTGTKGDHLAESLSILMNTGLLSSPQSILPGFTIGKLYFDKRDADILYHLIRGKTAKIIGKMLGLSNRTIEHRLEKMRVKLNVNSKSELIETVIDHFL